MNCSTSKSGKGVYVVDTAGLIEVLRYALARSTVLSVERPLSVLLYLGAFQAFSVSVEGQQCKCLGVGDTSPFFDLFPID